MMSLEFQLYECQMYEVTLKGKKNLIAIVDQVLGEEPVKVCKNIVMKIQPGIATFVAQRCCVKGNSLVK